MYDYDEASGGVTLEQAFGEHGPGFERAAGGTLVCGWEVLPALDWFLEPLLVFVLDRRVPFRYSNQGTDEGRDAGS